MTTRPNLIKTPHHAHVTGANGHWVSGGCDNAAKDFGLDRHVGPAVKDPFGVAAQLFTVNSFATIHPCIRMDYDFAGID